MSAATAGFKMSDKQYEFKRVIYALNTKNDEHEALVDALKKQHAAELDRVLASSREKLARCQSLIGQDSEYRRRIGQLEGSLVEAQERQTVSQREFGDFKVRVESRERELVQQQAQKAKDMTKQVTDIQEAYDRAIERFQGLLSEAKTARQRALDEQKAAYEKKLEEVNRSQRDIEASLSGATQKVHENYKAEIDGLRSRLDQEQAGRSKDAQDYEDKMKKQQQFHQKEIEALRAQAESGKADELDRLKRQHDELRKEHLAHQADARKERQGLIEKLAKAEDLAERLRLELTSVGHSDSAKDAEIARLSSELKVSSDDLKLQHESMRSLRIELQTATDKCEQQLKDIVKKSESIGELQASVLQHEGTIRRQAEELAQLQRRWDDLERKQSSRGREQDGLLRQAESQAQRLEQQLQQLREEKLHAERQAEEEKQRLLSEMDSKERALLQKQDKEAKQALKKYQDELKKQKAGFDSEVELLNQENSAKLELARNAAEKEKKEAQKELARVRRELEALAKARDERLRELEGQLRDKESGLGIQWTCFPVAYFMGTEKFYDLAGAATHLALLGFASRRLFPPSGPRGWTPVCMAAVWAVRLGCYLGYRGLRSGDRRFSRIKTRPGAFLAAWTMQGAWALGNLAPTLTALACMSAAGATAARRPMSLREPLGWALFCLGLAIEAAADWQKLAFRSEPANASRFISSGLWALSRHPNYFGELCLWAGLAASASASFTRPVHWASLAGPLLNACLLLFVSGLPPLEAAAKKRWGADPAYQEYARRTPLLVPRLPWGRD